MLTDHRIGDGVVVSGDRTPHGEVTGVEIDGTLIVTLLQSGRSKLVHPEDVLCRIESGL